MGGVFTDVRMCCVLQQMVMLIFQIHCAVRWRMYDFACARTTRMDRLYHKIELFLPR